MKLLKAGAGPAGPAIKHVFDCSGAASAAAALCWAFRFFSPWHIGWRVYLIQERNGPILARDIIEGRVTFQDQCHQWAWRPIIRAPMPRGEGGECVRIILWWMYSWWITQGKSGRRCCQTPTCDIIKDQGLFGQRVWHINNHPAQPKNKIGFPFKSNDTAIV